MHKHRAIIDLIPLPKDTDKFPYLMVRATYDSINKGVLAHGNIGPTKNAVFVDDNLLADILSPLQPALAFIFEALFMLLGKSESHLRQSPLSMDKHFKTM